MDKSNALPPGAPWLAHQIALRPISELKPSPRNPRTHSDQQVGQIAASIVANGFTNPILVDAGSNVLAGHGRLRAAERLGLTEVPVIELSHLTEAQRRAYIIADNKLALDAGWDDRLLLEELQAIQSGGLLELAGFNAEDLADLELKAEPLSPPAGGHEETGTAQRSQGTREITCPHCHAAFQYSMRSETVVVKKGQDD